MYQSITMQNYRRFQEFSLNGLGRVNLLVGMNNSGKSSILEAVRILATNGDPATLYQICALRGERSKDEDRRAVGSRYASIRHLFNNHLSNGTDFFRILDNREKQAHCIEFRIEEWIADAEWTKEVAPAETDRDLLSEQPLRLIISDNDNSEPISIPLHKNIGLSSEDIRRRVRPNFDRGLTNSYIPTSGVDPVDTIRLFDQIVLTPEEELVIEALRFLEPAVERIATTSEGQSISYRGERLGIVVKLRYSSERVPIGSLGDGMWRMLGIALAMVNAKDGVFLVDEIDTGLQYTVLENLWRMVYETAKRLNIQVFATTHSRDAYYSLAAIVDKDKLDNSDVTIHRIEPDKPCSVMYTEAEIYEAARSQIEVR